MGVSCKDILRHLLALKTPIIVVAIILAAIPIPVLITEQTMSENAKRCFYILVVMAVLWITEALPVAVTALLPIILFPLAGVLPAKQISGYYVNDTSMLFLGGLVVAVAVEEVNLHKRIAILILKGAGSEPKWLMLGIMLPTWFLSMWISNTAAASMMIPIVNAIINQTKTASRKSNNRYEDTSPTPMAPVAFEESIKESKEAKQGTNDHQMKLPDTDIEKNLTKTSPNNTPQTDDVRVQTGQTKIKSNVKDRDSRSQENIAKALSLSVAYACNSGGIATLTGTPPNLVMKGIADDFYRSYQKASNSSDTSGSGITFASWMSMALPLSFLVLVTAWLILVLAFIAGRGCCRPNKVQNTIVKKIIDREWKGLGPMSLAEIETLLVFVLLTVLWISRDPKESPGWGTLFESGYVTDSVSAMMCAFLFFVLPAKCSLGPLCCKKGDDRVHPYYSPILTWKKAQDKIPWGVILLLGGGFALAKGCKESGLSRWLGDQLAELDYLEPWVFNLAISFIVAAFTEVTSNTATATLLMPILADIAVTLKMNPLYLMMTSCIATSFAFMLPVATPPNAIVFSYGQIKIINMVWVGLFMNIMAVGLATLCVNTWGKLIFDFDTFDPIFNTTLPINS